jgi:predicted tellurium resistance membrane protein TerC
MCYICMCLGLNPFISRVISRLRSFPYVRGGFLFFVYVSLIVHMSFHSYIYNLLPIAYGVVLRLVHGSLVFPEVHATAHQ